MTIEQDHLRNLPIGVFDSGVGGLTVLSAIRKELPGENLLYLGDTARLPYGAKSGATVCNYALQAAENLVRREIKMLVIACNTATAAALPDLRQKYPKLPVVGVIEPGARKACSTTKTGHIVVIATESTINKDAYAKSIHSIKAGLKVTSIACPLLVPIAEEGWSGEGNSEHNREEHDIVLAVLKRYLGHIFPPKKDDRADCLLLGCTHFPHLRSVISEMTGPDVRLVDSAHTTALEVKELLKEKNIARIVSENSAPKAYEKFLTTDFPERFRKVGSRFLKADIRKEDLELISL